MNSSNSTGPVVQAGRILRDVRLAAVSAASSSGESTRCASARPEFETVKPAEAVPAESVDCETIRRAAFQQGLEAGRKEGARELGPVLDLLRSAAKALERAQGDLNRKFDEQVAELSLAIARKVVGREVNDVAAVRGVIVRALAQAPNRAAARVRLNPHDLRMLEQARHQHQDLSQRLPEDLVLLPDPQMTRGGCVIEGASGYVDARVETQLQLIEEALLAREQPEGEPAGERNKRP